MSKVFQSLFKNGQPGHHAYLVIGDPVAAQVELEARLRELFSPDFTNRSNPDFHQQTFASFGVDDSRLIRERQGHKAFGKAGKYFLLLIETITIEAQNALLKTLEEPAADTYFFLFCRERERFLPTILSRCEIVDYEGGDPAPSDVASAQTFLTTDPAGRQKLVKQLLALQEKNNLTVRHFLEQLLPLIRERWVNKGYDPVLTPAVTETKKALDYTVGRGESVRLLLEHLALILPVLQ